MTFLQNYFNYPADEVVWCLDDHQLIHEIKRWKYFLGVINRYDIFHFNFGMTFMPSQIDSKPVQSSTSNINPFIRHLYRIYAAIFQLRDLSLLKKMGKGVFVTYQGDDARQGDYCRKNFLITFANEVENSYYSAESDARKRHDIAVFDKFADRIYALNPDLLHVLPARAEFLPYANIDLREWKAVPSVDDGRPLQVLHAPSHQKVKGTKYLLEAVDRLKSEGFIFDFRLVEGISHADARKLYEHSDILVDQLFAGWYGGLAVELMALGKPVISYIRHEDLKFLPSGMRDEIPIINANPSNIYDSLKDTLRLSRSDLASIGARGRMYVERWHNPLHIAEKMKKEYAAVLSHHWAES